ncbi:hypothetical protein BDR07DRAFT_210729 [Suillus spraguei]|nr:hypothetical protein BDR07DRAFT_210729 [Suillus spraguei]
MSRYSSTTPSRILNVTRQTKVSNTNGYYPRCRDVDGTSVMIAQTATDLGAHTRWIYPEHDTNDNEEETGVDVDEGHTTSPSSTMTCLTQHAFDAGSVLLHICKRGPSRFSAAPSASASKGSISGITIYWELALTNRLAFLYIGMCCGGPSAPPRT